jgi:hypothetical protein
VPGTAAVGDDEGVGNAGGDAEGIEVAPPTPPTVRLIVVELLGGGVVAAVVGEPFSKPPTSVEGGGLSGSGGGIELIEVSVKVLLPMRTRMGEDCVRGMGSLM